MILTDKEIRDLTVNYKTKGLEAPLIENFDEDSLEGASYDISIVNTIHIMKKGMIIDIKNQNTLDDLYERKIIGEEGYIVNPGEYIFVGVNGKINLPDNLICEIFPKTKLTRAGLILSTQYCNPSYSGYLQLGLKNINQNPIIIYPGMKVGQYIFKELKSAPSDNKLYKNKKNASYQNEKQGEFRGPKFDKELMEKAAEKINELFKSRSEM